MRGAWLWLAVGLLTAWGGAGPLAAADRDGDGLTDKQEEILGTDPGKADVFTVIVKEGLESEKRRAAKTYDAAMDVLTVEFCHAGGDRYVWRTTLAGEPRPKDTVLHLYIDADTDRATGRKGSAKATSTGTEYMVTMAAGGMGVSCYEPDGARAPRLAGSFLVSGNSILMSADLNLARDDKGVRYAVYVLCHTAAKSPKMSDSTGRIELAGLPLVQRKKVKRLIDYTESVGVDRTFGIDLVRQTLKRKDVVVVPHDKLEMDGFEVDLFTYRRFANVRRTRFGGKAWAAAPKAGSYHVGFAILDDGSDERVAFKIDGEVKGVAVANADNYRWSMFWLREAYRFKGGERVEFVGFGPNGKHAICNMLFMPTPPEIRKQRFAVEHMTFHTPVGADGRVTVSWNTTWPCPTRFEYGPTAAYGKTATAERDALVHRVVLEGLDPKVEFHGRAVGVDKAGKPYHGPDTTFRAKAIEPPATVMGKRTIPLRVRNPHAVAAKAWPVTSGVPFPQGVLAGADHVRLMREGREVAAQAAVTGRWLDGSVKWILISSLADVAPKAEAVYTLEFGRRVRRAATGPKLSVGKGADGLRIDTGKLSVRIDAHGQVVAPSGKACPTVLVDAEGKTYTTANTKAEVTVEESGPIRAVVKTVTHATAADGAKSYRIESRVMAYAGQPFVRVLHTFVATCPETFNPIESMEYIVPAAAPNGWRVAVADGAPLQLGKAIPRVHQRFDREYMLGAAGADKPVKGRVVGSAVAGGPGGCAVVVRDFWQQYPKAFAAADDGLHVGLCPDFEAGLYDKFPFEKEGHQLYYYLLGGQYKFKRGMAKTHELMLCFAPEADREGLCRLFQRPLIATAPPKWMCATRAFYDVAVRDAKRFKVYEEMIDKNLKKYVDQRERQHDYGLMNYGDWYGERGANWGNIEYDTQHAFMLEYIRSGNPDAFFLADQTEIHNRDVDTIHWSTNPHDLGAVYVHQMGHVGGYYKKSVPGTLGIPRAGYTVSHAWTEGHFGHYFLTGDRRSYETGCAVADFFGCKEMGRMYDFQSCRVAGWHLIMNAAAYAATSDPFYLNVSRVIVERVLELQDVEPKPLPAYQCEPGRTHQQGGWSHMMLPGHCRCVPRHQGNAGFMVAILLSGLKYYHDVVEDPRVKESIIRGAHYLLDECYSEEVKGFRYTSCPKTGYRAGASFLMVEGVARAYRWTRDERLKRVLTEAVPLGARGSAYGKGFSFYYRFAPRVLADMAACGVMLNDLAKVEVVPFKKPAWMAKLGPKDLIVLQAEKFTGQGGGSCQIRDDRHGAWGKMITYWHRDIGHWLEWTFDVPADGRYAVRFRYASSCEDPTRELRIDGKVPCPEAKSIRFKPTGGFGHGPHDWKYRSLTGADGKEILLPLAKGRRRIRMTNLKDGLGLDFIALVRVK